MDHDLHPQRVIVGSETNPAKIARNWELVRELPHLIGDFTWTGWDYLGEAGIGRMRYASDDAVEGGLGSWAPYPWITANCGDIDITGFRLPVSYWREIVWGLRDAPYVAVRPPAHHGEEANLRQMWTFTDAIASWSWPGSEGQAHHGRGVRRRRRGRAPGERQVGRSGRRRRRTIRSSPSSTRATHRAS